MVDTRFFKNNGPFTLAQIAEICEAELEDKTKSDIKIKDMATKTVEATGGVKILGNNNSDTNK